LLTAALLAAPLVVGAGLLQRLVSGHQGASSAAVGAPAAVAPRGPAPAIEPRAVLGRYWFDRLPENDRDPVLTYLFLGGGVAIREEGSFWRSTTEYFDLERRGTTLALMSLHDGKKSEPTFRLERCDEKPPFDLCLTLEGGGEAARKLYGFTYGEDLMRSLPKGGAGSTRFAKARTE
jgi:hypothetical protein